MGRRVRSRPLLTIATIYCSFTRMIWIAAFLLTACHPGGYFPQLCKNRDERHERLGLGSPFDEKRDQTPSPA